MTKVITTANLEVSSVHCGVSTTWIHINVNGDKRVKTAMISVPYGDYDMTVYLYERDANPWIIEKDVRKSSSNNALEHVAELVRVHGLIDLEEM